MSTSRTPTNKVEPGPGRHAGDRAQAVMLVDDSTGYLAVASAVVEATDGFEVVCTATGVAEAIEAIGALSVVPDLLLLDLNLGDGTGIDVAGAVAADRPSMRVVLMSTLSAEDLPLEARHCGAAGYLPKVSLGPASLRLAAQGAYDWAP